MPKKGETLLIGATNDGVWTRTIVSHRLTAPLMVRGLITLKKLDRMAIVIPGDSSREFRVAFADRESAGDPAGVSDRRLARLVGAAAYEWKHPRALPGPMRQWFGRPYPIVVLVIVLGTELGFDLLRIPRLLSGGYSWIPDIPRTAAGVIFAAYLLLILATIVALWRQAATGFALAGLLSAVQAAWSLAYYLPLVPTYGRETIVFFIVWSWSFPAMIWLMLGLLYLERLRRTRL